MSKQPFIIAVAGGSGSGKTTFAKKLKRLYKEGMISILAQDHYYIDQHHRFDHDGGEVNFDHPESLEFSLLATHIRELKANKSIQIPQYDFVSHTRSSETSYFAPTPVVLVDGTLILHAPELKHIFDLSYFIDTPEDVRFERRFNRDTKERGRDPEGVKNQFVHHVKPMHDLFVEPSKAHADQVVNMDQFDQMLKDLSQTLADKHQLEFA
jgi:uridine kinase